MKGGAGPIRTDGTCAHAKLQRECWRVLFHPRLRNCGNGRVRISTKLICLKGSNRMTALSANKAWMKFYI